jgi:hypothetical protein
MTHSTRSPRRRTLAGLVILAVFATISVASSQDGARDGDPDLDHAKALLGNMIGTWDTAMSMGGGEPINGTSVIRAVEGSSFVFEEAHSEVFGQPFMGLGIVGYDQQTRTWMTVWIDSAESGLSVSAGQFDKDNKSLVKRSEATADAPAQLQITRFTGDDSFVFVMGPDGDDFKPELVIQYQRRK